MRLVSGTFTVAACAAVVAGCGGTAAPSRLASRPLTVEHADGIRYSVPPAWHVAPRSLTPHLVNPREVLTIGTGALPAGGRCAQFPSAALSAMGPRDVLVTVQERFGSPRGFPGRPARFSLPHAQRSEAETCAGRGAAFASHRFEFRDGGRGFHVLVAVAPSAPPARVAQAVAVLDSLRIAPRRPARIDADQAIPYDSPGQGLRVVFPAGWRVYGRGLTQAIGGRDQLALGTFRLPQRAPDSNCTPARALRARPMGGGFIYMFEIQGLNRRALAKIPGRPARLRLPRSSYQPYECFGLSWMVRFRDGGRAFQAHVYGPPRRRREALAILDSLRVQPAPFDSHIRAARFPSAPGWHTRISGPSHESPCLRQRVSWASTVRFADGSQDLPPTRTVERLPANGIVMAAVQALDRCRRPSGLRALTPPLDLRRATRSQFPGPRGTELPLYRLLGRFAGRYTLDVWVIYGRRAPTAAQRAAAERELAGVRWPAWL